jgi:hypothetical protein
MKRIALVVSATLIAAAVPAIAIANQPAENTPLHHYIGSLHEHSGYSDGFPGSQPRDYYASAKGYGLDFLGSGEHSDSADLPMVVSEECLAPTIASCASAEDPADPDHGQDSLRKWDATKEQAQAATTANFTGFRGFEWTSDRFGHINVYFSRNDTNAKVDGGYASMDTFYNWLTRDPLLEGGGDGLATFNHPGDKSQEPLPGLNWNDFTYEPAADNQMAGIEVFNGNKDFGSYYSHALDKGWHLGAIGAEDKGHDPSDGDGAGDDDWGGPKWAKTVFIATDQSEAGLREAMASRRMYAVQDNTIRMDFRAGGHPMGSRISREQGATIGLEFDLWHESVGTATSSPLDRVEFVTNGGAIAAVAPITEGDGPDLTFDAPVVAGESYYFARVIGADGKPLAFSSPVWISRSIAQGGEWLAGDLHIHTTYSHDSYGGPDDENTQDPADWYTIGHPVTSQFAVALSRGLDYLAITDHNDIRSQTDAGWQFAKDNGLVPIPGYENSLSGHAQMLGAEQIYDKGNATAPEVDAMADALRADGGLFQINHPFDDSGVSWKYGYDVVPDTVEVWNIPRPYQPPFPSATDNDKGTAFWEHFLDAGYHVGATGGADNHYIATTPIQGAGQPTTWVFAKDRSQAAILEGLREGRTFISHQPPNMGGPQLFLEADADGDGTYEAVVGDTVPAGSNFRARVVGAPGATLRAFTNGGAQAGLDAVVGPFEVAVTPKPDSTWIRVEIGYPDAEAQREQACDGQLGGETTYCRNKLTVLAMTSAIYIQQPHPGTPGATDLI